MHRIPLAQQWHSIGTMERPCETGTHTWGGRCNTSYVLSSLRLRYPGTSSYTRGGLRLKVSKSSAKRCSMSVTPCSVCYTMSFVASLDVHTQGGGHLPSRCDLAQRGRTCHRKPSCVRAAAAGAAQAQMGHHLAHETAPASDAPCPRLQSTASPTLRHKTSQRSPVTQTPQHKAGQTPSRQRTDGP